MASLPPKFLSFSHSFGRKQKHLYRVTEKVVPFSLRAKRVIPSEARDLHFLARCSLDKQVPRFARDDKKEEG
ncbi:MAG: hypothetical protein A3J28_08745 [Acidobacteria bacterium RIFCSPLOWO2_12_FULL_60_22]|nr:MAG: hypothetical protein A3J28_08745 [Acidobacteria bacterium RIFCSPLOWO2_12_FULL_60_22]